MARSSEKWDQIKELFEAALEKSANLRSAYVTDKAPDAEVREEVLRLLAEHESADGFLSNAAFAEVSAPWALDAARVSFGDVLDGKFKIIRLLAEGGMGQVWLAEQTTPLQRQVVVKFIKAG